MKLFIILIRITYKRTGGNTINLHKHLQKKHPNKVEKVETGEIDKYVEREVPVSVYFFFVSKSLHLCFYLANIDKGI